jgi:hypothetical protein
LPSGCGFLRWKVFGIALGSRLLLLRRAIELQDAVGVNLRQPPLDWRGARIASSVFLVLAIAQFALDLNVCAFLQFAGKLSEFAPYGAAMPLGARVVAVLRVLPRSFGCDAKYGDRSAVFGGFELRVVTDEADEGNAVLLHGLNLLFLPCTFTGHLRQVAPAPQAKLCIFRRNRKRCCSAEPIFLGGTGNPEGRAAEAEERCAARAQEKLTACRARERAGRKRAYQNRSHWLGVETAG